MSGVVKKGVVEQTEEEAIQLLFTKQQLLRSQKYAGQRDILSAILDDDDSYTTAEVESKIKSFLGTKGKVRK